MATDINQLRNEINELEKRLGWLDQERLKSSKRTTALEQQLTVLERKLEGRDQRIKELEDKLLLANKRISRVSQSESDRELFKDEIVKLIDRSDKRRAEGQEELEKLRSVEHEMNQREFSDIKKQIAVIGRIQNDIEQLKSEEQRLTSLLGNQKTSIGSLTSEIENLGQQLAFITESERSNAKLIGDLQTTEVESLKKIEALDTRIEVTSHKQTRIQTKTQELTGAVADLQQSLKEKLDQFQISDHQRNKKLDDWQTNLDEFQHTMDRFNNEWVKFSTQYKESKMAVKTLLDWQSRIEAQQKEAAELARIESKQLMSRWENFLADQSKRWKNYEVDREQRWARADRWEKNILEQMQEIQDILGELQQEKDALWRVQSAQADVMKMLPRIWKEEMEKARSLNPNSRRQPALVPVREE